LREGEDAQFAIPDLAPLAEETPQRAASPPVSTEAPVVSEKRDTMFYVAGAGACAGYVTAIVTGILALTAHSAVSSKCPDGAHCTDPSGIDDASRARTLAWVSTVALGVGVVGTVTALLWPMAKVTSKGSSVGLLKSADATGILFRGTL
jgi:hypothetical protein